MEHTKVLLLLLAVLLPMKGALSQSCSMTIAQELAALKLSGAGPLGAFNKDYMALTKSDAKRFPDLLSAMMGQHSTTLVRKKRALKWPFDAKTYPNTTISGPCGTGNRSCSSCPATTDLGPDIIPRFINEVICESQVALCNSGHGLCMTTVVPQTFLHKTGKCDANGHEILEQFVQDIRACCECFLF